MTRVMLRARLCCAKTFVTRADSTINREELAGSRCLCSRDGQAQIGSARTAILPTVLTRKHLVLM